MVRLSLHRRVPWLLATGSLALGCGPSLLGDTDTDGSSDTDVTATGETVGTDPTAPTGPNPTSPSDPSTVSITVTDPSSPSDPTIDPTGPAPHPGPPQLVDGRVLDAYTVELFFSEPIAAIGAIDPSKFRLSAAFSNAYYGYSTWYSDLGRWNGEEVCNEYCYYDECYEWCYTPQGPPAHVVSAINSGYAERVLLGLDQPITSNLCRELQKRLDQGADVSALFLHYSNNGAGITDLDGEQLDAIAEHWVLLSQQTYSYQPDSFPYMNPFIPIDCPF